MASGEDAEETETPQAVAEQREQEALSSDTDGQQRRCDYCRLPAPREPVTAKIAGQEYEFCCTACRDALAEQSQVFTEYHGHRRLRTGVSAMDASLPQGVPRNSLVMLTDFAGTRAEAVRAELVWRALERGEPVVFVSFLEPPVSVVQEFVSLSWNVFPALEAGDLQVVDCFSYRVDDRDRMHRRMNDWNQHVSEVVDDATITVRDPTNMAQLQNRLDGALEAAGAEDEGLVVIDSLTELGSLVQPVQAYNFLKDVRADVCKGRFVPVFAGATVSGEGEEFPHDLGYMVDGLVEMRLNEELVENTLIKQLRVRKMSGVLSDPRWQVYEFAAGAGLITFEADAEQENGESSDEGDKQKTDDEEDGQTANDENDGQKTDDEDEGQTTDDEDDEQTTGDGEDEQTTDDEEDKQTTDDE